VTREPGDLPSTVVTRGRVGRGVPTRSCVPAQAPSPRWRATRRPPMRSFLSTLILLAAFAAQAAPVQVTDAVGRTVTVDAPVERVVPVFNYEEFTAIAGKDAWNKVVAYNRKPWETYRHSIWRRYADAIPRLVDLPDVGHPEDNTFSVEKVLAVRPQVVLMPQWGYATHAAAIEQLAAVGIPTVVIDYNAQILERHIASTLAIGKVMGSDDRARDLVELYKREVADVQRRVASAPQGDKRPTVYLEVAMEGPEVAGSTFTTTMWGRVLDMVGAENVAKGRLSAAQAPMNPEAVLAANPDVIFLAGSSWRNQPRSVRLGYEVDEAGARASLQPYLDRPGWRTLKAVQNRRVYAIQHGLARTLFDFTAMQMIAKQLYPAAFSDVDPIANLKAYHERWLPIAFGGVWMVVAEP
jgi:iron complex transport system substrate-binding protein